MSYLPELRAALLRAAADRSKRSEPGSAAKRFGLRWRSATRAIGLAASVLVTAGVAAVLLTLNGHAHHSTSTLRSHPARSPNPRELRYIDAAAKAVQRSDPACRLRLRRIISHGSPGQPLLAILGVLRRPATAADRPPHVDSLLFVMRVLYVDYIRLARVAYGEHWYLVPGEMRTLPPTQPARCFTEQVAALRRERARIPPSLWRATVQLQAQLLARQRNAPRKRPYATVFTVAFGPGVGFGGGDGTPSVIEAGRDLGTYGSLLYGAVPDGVAAVTVYYATSNPHPRRRPSVLKVTAKVIGNLFVVNLPHTNGGNFGKQIVWYSAKGNVLKRVQPNP
jgi:hypothetical protein